MGGKSDPLAAALSLGFPEGSAVLLNLNHLGSPKLLS
jgi:hypothetical protein